MDVYVITTRQDYSTAGDGTGLTASGPITGVEGVYASKPYFDKLAEVCISMEEGAVSVLKDGGADTSHLSVSIEVDNNWIRKSVLTCGNTVITTTVELTKCELKGRQMVWLDGGAKFTEGAE